MLHVATEKAFVPESSSRYHSLKTETFGISVVGVGGQDAFVGVVAEVGLPSQGTKALVNQLQSTDPCADVAFDCLYCFRFVFFSMLGSVAKDRK